MDDLILTKAHYLSLIVFVSVLFIMGLLEHFYPRRQRKVPQIKRWINNLSLVALNTMIVRFFLPVTLVSLAFYCQSQNIGILNSVKLPNYIEVILAFVIFDFFIYLQHVFFHKIPVLWKLHQVHHADLDLDVTSGLRFHTIEIVASMFIKYALVVTVGPPLLAIFLFEIILNACSMFNHSNVKIPNFIDKSLRWIIVTPDMHRIHHSTENKEINSNFGFNLTWWDRLLGTYVAEPQLGQKNMNIGLKYVQNESEATYILNLLKMPFTKTEKNSTLQRN